MPAEFDEHDQLEDAEGADFWEAMKQRMPLEVQERVDAFVREARRPLGPGDPRRHHFLPQFFQKRFATEQGQLLVVPIDRSAPRLTHVTNIAVMSDLYTSIDKEIGETVAVEKVLALADGQASGAIARLAYGVLFPPSARDREDLAIWLALLHVRDPYTRRRTEAMADHVFKSVSSLAANPLVARSRLRESLGREPTEAEVAELVDATDHLDQLEATPHQNELVKLMLTTALELVPYLLTRRIVVLRFPEPGLVLSDRPLVLQQDPENRDPFRGVGIGTADEILLPLDRSTAMILHSRPSIRDHVMNAPPDCTVDDFNQAVVANAAAEVYCHPDDSGRLERVRFRDADRPLMHVDGASWVKAKTDGINAPPVRKRHRRYRHDGP